MNLASFAGLHKKMYRWITRKESNNIEKATQSTNETFKYCENGLDYPMFSHNFNCGYPGSPRSERAIELALADYWLQNLISVCEIGAVTPYYWPRRISHIIDPSDKHPLVTHKGSLFDYNFKNSNVLSISTLEHVGLNDYGLTEGKSAVDALLKVTTECSTCLITLPIGWNDELDKFLFSMDYNALFKLTFLKRTNKHGWVIAKSSQAYAKYGLPLSYWANSLAVIEIGSILI